MAKKRNQRNLKAVQAAKARKKRRNRRRRRAIVLAIEVIILLALSATAFVMAKYDKFQRVEINSDDIKINSGVKKEGYTTVALFGGDSREGELEAGTRTDTIIVVALDHKEGVIRMASIYRDTLLQQDDNLLILISHGDTLGMLQALWLKLEADALNSIQFAGQAGGVSCLWERDGKRIVRKFNDLSYLK